MLPQREFDVAGAVDAGGLGRVGEENERPVAAPDLRRAGSRSGPRASLNQRADDGRQDPHAGSLDPRSERTDRHDGPVAGPVGSASGGGGQTRSDGNVAGPLPMVGRFLAAQPHRCGRVRTRKDDYSGLRARTVCSGLRQPGSVPADLQRLDLHDGHAGRHVCLLRATWRSR